MMVAILATACGGDDGGPTPDQLTTPGAGASVTCDVVDAQPADVVGSWSLDWYCDGYTEGSGEQVPRACDPGRLPVGLDDVLAVTATEARIGPIAAALSGNGSGIGGQVMGDGTPAPIDIMTIGLCPDGTSIVWLLDDYGDNSRTAWRARAERL